MNLTYSTTAEQDAALAELRKEYNRKHGTTLTVKQFAEARIETAIASAIAEAETIVKRSDLVAAYDGADDAKKAEIRSLLNL